MLTYLSHDRWLLRPVPAVLFTLISVQLLAGGVCGAEEPADPYDTLYDVLMTRWKDGKSYAQNETSPAIFAWSEFPFDDETFEKFDAALDEFAALPQEKIEQYNDVKRALLQRHLWEAFDTTFPFNWSRNVAWSGRLWFPRSHMNRRVALQPRIASLIRRLALTKAQIHALPNTMAATVKSGGFAQHHDTRDRFKPFLPADLYSQESSWICLGENERPFPAGVHTRKLNMRSNFIPFVRLPGGRTETLRFMQESKNRKLFPVGTKLALVEQAFLISDDGELILSPLIVSIQLRAYLDVDRNALEARPEATQCVAEFVMQPRELFQGNAIMKAMTPRDHRFGIAGPDAADFSPYDPFGTGRISEGMPTITRLNACMGCHGGKPGVRTRIFMATRLTFKEGSPEAISKATAAQKRDDRTWKRLRELWQADLQNSPTTTSAARPEESQSLLASNRQPGGRESAADADPYDVLYDVIMVRKDSDGNAYSTNEVGPLIYRRSKFPFDDETYPRLTAAMERFNALSETQIEAYGTVKRALLQRHLWVVFDATIPNDYKPPTHLDRRRATQQMLAALISRVALTKAEILALPDTRAATIKNGGFPQEHDPADRFKPFLPADLYAKESSWVCMGKVGNPGTNHARIDRWRSTFLQFVRLPGGREVTREYIGKLNDREVFPIGTQFALIDQAFLISDEGELVLSPVINSIELRAYLNVTMTDLEARPKAIVCVAEFVTQPEQLKEGKFAMKALGPKDFRFQTISADTGGRVDPLEGSTATAARNMTPALQQCIFCHERSRAGVRSLGAFMFGDRQVDKLTFEVGSPAGIAESVAASKRRDETWKRLQELWQADSDGGG